MNEFTFKELQTAYADKTADTEQSFSVTVTQEMMDNFLKITGDCNPMHTDREYALKNGFDSCLVYGLLSASFYSTLAGVYLPGKYCLLQEVSTQFSKPVFIGDVLTVSGKVSDVQETFKRIVIKAKIMNQHGKTVNRASITAGVLK